MKGVRIVVVLGVVAVVALLVRHFALAPSTLVLTGVVTTQDVIMSPQIGGRVNQLLVKEGDLVVAGQRVAAVGTTGRSTGPHLHFEVRLNGVPQNPARFLKAGN